MITAKTFRILAATLALAILTPLHASAAGWETIFDGKGEPRLRGYKQPGFPKEGWMIESGVLKTNPKGKPIDLVTLDEYHDFELELEWKATHGANSGIIYRATENFDASYMTGPEMQVLDDEKHPDGKNPKTQAGSLYALIAATNKKLRPVGEWNKARLVIRNNQVEHWLNGRKVVSYVWGSPEIKTLIAQSKFKDMPGFAKNEKGRIVLQHHHDEVWYRKIKVRVLKTH